MEEEADVGVGAVDVKEGGAEAKAEAGEWR